MTLTQKKASISTLHFSKGNWNLGVHSHYSHLWGTAVRLGRRTHIPKPILASSRNDFLVFCHTLLIVARPGHLHNW